MPESGNYAVYVNGFTVHQQTWDDALQWDGNGDEVFIPVKVAVTTDGKAFSQPLRRTPTMGDTNGKNGRVKAGSLSNKGGLQTGDEFPTPNPYQRQVPVAPTVPPWKVWEGTLEQGRHVLTVIPAIMEDDEGGEHPFNAWVAWADQAVDTMAPSLQQLLGPEALPYLTATQAGLEVLSSLPNVVGKKGTRPIGIQNGTAEPTLLVLDHAAAERLVDSDPQGLGPGVVQFSYQDSTELGAGSYSLYLQVERA